MGVDAVLRDCALLTRTHPRQGPQGFRPMGTDKAFLVSEAQRKGMASPSSGPSMFTDSRPVCAKTRKCGSFLQMTAMPDHPVTETPIRASSLLLLCCSQ